MNEISKNSFDFMVAFSGNESVFSQFLVEFIDSDDFKVVAVEVAEGNPYIQTGESPTGLRDLDYSKKIKVIHLASGTEQLLYQDEEESDYFHLGRPTTARDSV